MVGYVKTVSGGIGYDVGLGDIAGKIGEDIVDLRSFFCGVFAKAVEGAAEGCGSVDNGLAVDRVSGESLDLGSAGVSVHIARDDAGQVLFGKVSDNVKRTELSSLRALVIEVGVEEDEDLVGILMLESSRGVNAGASALVSRIARAGNEGSSREPTGLKCDQLEIIALESDAGCFAAVVRTASAAHYGVAERGKLVAEPLLHRRSSLLKSDNVGGVLFDGICNSTLAVVEDIVAVNIGDNAQIKCTNFDFGAHFESLLYILFCFGFS